MIIGNREMYARIVDCQGNRLFPDELLDMYCKEPITMNDLVNAHIERDYEWDATFEENNEDPSD